MDPTNYNMVDPLQLKGQWPTNLIYPLHHNKVEMRVFHELIEVMYPTHFGDGSNFCDSPI
jgi:hypothetical protein